MKGGGSADPGGGLFGGAFRLAAPPHLRVVEALGHLQAERGQKKYTQCGALFRFRPGSQEINVECGYRIH
jgi:hypothetical protein